MARCKMNILYLFPKQLWETKMSPGRRHYAMALSDYAEVTVSGAGWPGWNTTVSVRVNLKRLGLKPDVIWAYKPETTPGVTERDCPLFVCYNECWPHIPGKALKEVQDCAADLVIHHHANDAACFDGFRGIVRNIPHAAHDMFYSGQSHRMRVSHCLSSGVQSPEIYPVRHRLNTLVKSGNLPGIIRNHPGYRLHGLTECDTQTFRYANTLANSRVSLCCASKYHYMLAKIIESAMSGCLVVTDAPDDPAFELLRPHVLVVQDGESDESIVERIMAADTQKLGFAAQQVAREHFSMQNYCQTLLAYTQELL